MNSTKALGIMILWLLAGLGAIPATADQITLASSSQNVTLTGTGGTTNLLNVQLGTFSAGVYTLSGIAIGADGELGSYSFVTTGVPSFGPNNGSGVFPWVSGGSTVFNFIDTTDGDSNLTNVAVTYLDMANGSSDPHLDFATSLGSVHGEFILSPISCSLSVSPCNIDNAALVTNGTASGPISAGQVPVRTPEPGTSNLLGAGLVSLFALAGWRRKIRPVS